MIELINWCVLRVGCFCKVYKGLQVIGIIGGLCCCYGVVKGMVNNDGIFDI